MRYDFDEQVQRIGTNSIKWEATEQLFGEKDLLPLWVADMDFKAPCNVVDALVKRAQHGIFGYNLIPDSYYEAVIQWMSKRHQWQIEKDWIAYTPGVVPALNFIVQTFTNPGDKVIIQSPVYYPFKNCVVNNNRELVTNPLKLIDGKYEMDFDDLIKKMEPDVKLLILCNPHNPSGRVWTKEDLKKLGEICLENNILVVSDEIHHDLVIGKQKYTPFGTISDELANNAIICTAPSKTFNLAGLQTSNIIIKNPEIRQKFKDTLLKLSLTHLNTFGMIATEVAYRDGEEWLDQLLIYLEKNIDVVTKFIQENIPKIKVIQPESTYLVWLDCRDLGMDFKELEKVLLTKAKIAVNQGYTYGMEGEGFIRINAACSTKILEQGLSNLVSGIKEYNKETQTIS